MDNYAPLFPDSYEQSRERFRNCLSELKKFWWSASLSTYAIDSQEDLTIDWLYAEASESQQKLLILSTGEHGIEGYVGSAMQYLFIKEYLSKLDFTNTSLLLIHAINPWGMAHKRRTNKNNVDLNRTFLWDWRESQADNEIYSNLNAYLNPAEKIDNYYFGYVGFVLKTIWIIISSKSNIWNTGVLSGQYHFPEGIYFGGFEPQEETQKIMGVYEQYISSHQKILHLDMHTGYGPRYQMSLVNSALEKKSSVSHAQAFNYPLVVKANPDEFYAIKGDMIDYIHRLMGEKHPDKHFYATAFEFGTFGDSLFASLRSLWAVILENQLYWHGANSQPTKDHIENLFVELFYPSNEKWRKKAVQDARQAFDGILSAEGYSTRN